MAAIAAMGRSYSSLFPLRNNASIINNAAPTLIAASATLNDGKAQLPNQTWIKSVT